MIDPHFEFEDALRRLDAEDAMKIVRSHLPLLKTTLRQPYTSIVAAAQQAPGLPTATKDAWCREIMKSLREFFPLRPECDTVMSALLLMTPALVNTSLWVREQLNYPVSMQQREGWMMVLMQAGNSVNWQEVRAWPTEEASLPRANWEHVILAQSVLRGAHPTELEALANTCPSNFDERKWRKALSHVITCADFLASRPPYVQPLCVHPKSLQWMASRWGAQAPRKMLGDAMSFKSHPTLETFFLGLEAEINQTTLEQNTLPVFNARPAARF